MSEAKLPVEVTVKLEQFVLAVKQELLDANNIHYFKIDPQQRHEDQLNGFNRDQLRQVPDKSGVYALWIRKDTTATVQYIGHSAGRTARIRITNHFFKRDPRTGSQLDRIKQAVTDGCTVGFTYVALQPAGIRLYVESELIAQCSDSDTWNIHSKGPKQKSTTSGSS